MVIGAVTDRYIVNGTTMFKMELFNYIPSKYCYHISEYKTNRTEVLKAIKNRKLVLCNVSITSDNKIRVLDFRKMEVKDFIKHILVVCRGYIEAIHGTGTDLCGSCIEASELIVFILKYFGYNNCKTVEGWCEYDDDSSCSDRPYDEHTWVELENGRIYVDITADQFNYCMYKSNKFAPIIMQRDLPHGMCYEEPEGWEPEEGWDE